MKHIAQFNQIGDKASFFFVKPNDINYIRFIGIDDGIEDCRDMFRIQFRWSLDDVEFSEWMDYSPEIINYLGIVCKQFFSIDFQYELIVETENPICIYQFSLQLEQNFNDVLTTVPLQVFRTETGSNYQPCENHCMTFDVYGSMKDCVIRNEHVKQQLIVNTYGLNVTYMKLNPVAESKDPFLVEWGLLTYDEPRQIKIMLPENQFPDYRWNINRWGIEWDSTEIEINKYYFECIFGIGSSPQKGDYIYFHEINRMYQVTSMDVIRGAFFVITGFKLYLQQAYKGENVSMPESDDVQEAINKFMNINERNIDKMFNDELRDEEKKIENKLELSPKISNSPGFNELRRLHFDDNLCLKYEDLFINEILISKAHYYQYNISEKHYWKTFVSYNALPSDITDNFVFSCWYMLSDDDYKEINIRSIVENENQIEIEVTSMPKSQFLNELSEFIIKNENDAVFVAKFISYNRSKRKLIVKVDERYIIDNLENCTVKQFKRKNFIYSENFEVNHLTDGYIEIRVGDVINVVKIHHLTHQWCGLLIKYLPELGNILAVYQYDPTSENSIVKSQQFLTGEIICTPENLIKQQRQYEIKVSDISLTQIRIATNNIPEEQIALYFQSYLAQDANNLILSDICQPQFGGHYIGNVK